MRILILTFYYTPDLSAGSFRTSALVNALLERLPKTVHVDVVTTLPNRYDSFTGNAQTVQELPRLTIRRIEVPSHGSGMLGQARAFVTYAREATAIAKRGQYDLVFATSSRLMTAALSAHIAGTRRLPLYLDIRDIFTETIKDVLPRGGGWLAQRLFSILERWTIPQARSVNLVSPGFEDYFSRRYPLQRYSYFTNGIDDDFIDAGYADARVALGRARPLVVLYAGNIGESQGLHTVLPALARRLEGRVAFRVIGDGGRKRQLEQELTRTGCTNVEVFPPVRRDRLIGAYLEADVLFLHLNDYPAFKSVLPSKLFEYAATGRPVWAGVAGYAASFVDAEIENAAVFPPCNVDGAVRAFGELRLETVPRPEFLAKYDRASIMSEMAADIAQFLPGAAPNDSADA